MTSNALKSKLLGLLRQKDGNFAMMAAVTLPVFFMAASLAIDTSNAMSMKVRMQNAADSAALATATRLSTEDDLTVDEAKAFAAAFVKGQVEEDLPAFANLTVEPTVTITPVEKDGRTIWKVSVALNGSQSATPMARFLGQDSMKVNLVGKSESAGASQGAFSMALVLDQSGSMDWDLTPNNKDDKIIGPDGEELASTKKIDVLKVAVATLVAQFKEADPDRKYVRLGASSYNNRLRGTQSLGWNPNRTANFVYALEAEGGTDSTDAFEWARDALLHSREDNQHMTRNGLVPKKYIVFMTDGDNNYNSADSSTKILCNNAKANGIEIYSVAFAAPTRGKALLSYCASSAEHFYDATDSAQLVAAFKNIGMQASKMVSRLTE